MHEISHRKTILESLIGRLDASTLKSFEINMFFIHLCLSSARITRLFARYLFFFFFKTVCRRHVTPANTRTKFRKPTCKPIYRRNKTTTNSIILSRPAAKGSILETSVQVFSIRISQSANNICDENNSHASTGFPHSSSILSFP